MRKRAMALKGALPLRRAVSLPLNVTSKKNTHDFLLAPNILAEGKESPLVGGGIHGAALDGTGDSAYPPPTEFRAQLSGGLCGRLTA